MLQHQLSLSDLLYVACMPPNQRLHLTPQVGAVAEWTRGTLQGTRSVFQVAFWVLAPGFQKIKYVCGAGEPQPLGGNQHRPTTKGKQS